MVKVENECVDCGLPCLYESCPYWAVTRFYCDECDEEAELYWYEDEQLCIDCIEKDLKGLNAMIEKNKKKEEAKKQRNLWPFSPVTRTVESKKKYSRKKDRKDKRLYD